MKVVYIKSRNLFGVVKENSPVGSYIHYMELKSGFRSRISLPDDILCLDDYINNPRSWGYEEINMICMLYPEFNRDAVERAAKLAKVAG